MANNMLNLELLANRRARRNRNNAIRAGQMGTMMNPGTMSALPPTMTMRAGEVLTDYFSGLRKVFPEANPIGQAIEDFMLQPSEEMAAQMVEGNPYAVFDTRAGQQLINPALPEAVGLAPVGAIAKTPAVVAPAAIYAAGRGAEGLLGITDAIKKAQAEAPGLVEGLLTAGMGRDPAMSVSMATVPPMDEASRLQRAKEMGFDTSAYHGSTHDIEAFDASQSNPSNDWGKAIYTTSSVDDVNPNYAREGADLNARIMARQEIIATEKGLPLEDKQALEQARSELVGESEGVVYPLEINTEKYAVIGDDSTYIEMPDYRAEAMEEIIISEPHVVSEPT